MSTENTDPREREKWSIPIPALLNYGHTEAFRINLRNRYDLDENVSSAILMANSQMMKPVVEAINARFDRIERRNLYGVAGIIVTVLGTALAIGVTVYLT